MSQGISPQLEEKIKRYQAIQQQMATVQQQVQALKIEHMDIEKALKEIEELPDDEVCYRSIGRLMVKSTIKDTKEKLKDQKELTETRVKLSEKSSDKLKSQFEDLEKEIRAALEGGSKK
ncbi:MAG TPA: prefoldin subunit beta [Candidatus Bathyarchaeia archaeon]|nr:prefoldin subunit beta [Candidatus Bathyarchaeia archaeon]